MRVFIYFVFLSPSILYLASRRFFVLCELFDFVCGLSAVLRFAIGIEYYKIRNNATHRVVYNTHVFYTIPMNTTIKKENIEEEALMDTLGLNGEEATNLIDLVEAGVDEEEALDVIDDNTADPTTNDPYQNEESVL